LKALTKIKENWETWKTKVEKAYKTLREVTRETVYDLQDQGKKS